MSTVVTQEPRLGDFGSGQGGLWLVVGRSGLHQSRLEVADMAKTAKAHFERDGGVGIITLVDPAPREDSVQAEIIGLFSHC